jgi:hypothetical protein
MSALGSLCPAFMRSMIRLRSWWVVYTPFYGFVLDTLLIVAVKQPSNIK